VECRGLEKGIIYKRIIPPSAMQMGGDDTNLGPLKKNIRIGSGPRFGSNEDKLST